MNQAALISQILSMKEPIKMPTMAQKLDIVLEWYCGFAIYEAANCSLREISEFLVSKNLAADLDTGYKYLAQVFKIANLPLEIAKGKIMEYSDFCKLFMISIFKESIVQTVGDVENASKYLILKQKNGKN